MNYKRLEKNITDNIKEALLKLGYDNRPISLNYMKSSLMNLLCTEDDVLSALENFSSYASERLGSVTFREIKDGYCITVSAEGTSYINNLNNYTFLENFINIIRNHDADIQDIILLFKKYSDDIIIEEMHNGEFDYLIYSPSGIPDEYLYCISAEEEIDGHTHITYHRFIKEDYTALGF